MNRLIMTFIFLAFSFCSGMAQSKIIIEQDTLVVLTPSQLSIINGKLEELDWANYMLALKDNLIKANSVLIDEQQEQLKIRQERILVAEEQNRKLKAEIKKKNRKSNWLIGIASALGAGLITSIILK